MLYYMFCYVCVCVWLWLIHAPSLGLSIWFHKNLSTLFFTTHSIQQQTFLHYTGMKYKKFFIQYNHPNAIVFCGQLFVLKILGFWLNTTTASTTRLPTICSLIVHMYKYYKLCAHVLTYFHNHSLLVSSCFRCRLLSQ